MLLCSIFQRKSPGVKQFTKENCRLGHIFRLPESKPYRTALEVNRPLRAARGGLKFTSENNIKHEQDIVIKGINYT